MTRPILALGIALWTSVAGATPLELLELPDLTLAGTDGKSHRLREEAFASKLTVLTFFSADCPCMQEHDAVMKQLAQELGPKGARFIFVDPESHANLDKDRREAERRGYPWPILLDPGGRLSRALEAKFATATVIVDGEGKVHYRGGIDSSKRHPTPETRPYLREALVALLAGEKPPEAEPKSLGCYLRQR
jgi:peroxiredoxin